MIDTKVISQSPDILGGQQVFSGTRVPASTLFDYIIKGHSIQDFLDDFPSVSTEQAYTALKQSKDDFLGARHEAAA